jgi:transposase-like protein
MTHQTGKPGGSMPLHAYSVQDLARLYRVNKVTFKKWIKPFEEAIGERIGHFYTVKQVLVIIDKLGLPDGMETNE